MNKVLLLLRVGAILAIVSSAFGAIAIGMAGLAPLVSSNNLRNVVLFLFIVLPIGQTVCFAIAIQKERQSLKIPIALYSGIIIALPAAFAFAEFARGAV